MRIKLILDQIKGPMEGDLNHNSDSDTELDMAKGNHLEVLMRKIEQMEIAMRKQRCGNKSTTKWTSSSENKEEDKGRYAQTWDANTTPETHYPIVRVKAMLEQSKLTDETQEYLQAIARGSDSGKR